MCGRASIADLPGFGVLRIAANAEDNSDQLKISAASISGANGAHPVSDY